MPQRREPFGDELRGRGRHGHDAHTALERRQHFLEIVGVTDAHAVPPRADERRVRIEDAADVELLFAVFEERRERVTEIAEADDRDAPVAIEAEQPRQFAHERDHAIALTAPAEGAQPREVLAHLRRRNAAADAHRELLGCQHRDAVSHRVFQAAVVKEESG